jgi:hypothetical protein
VARIAQKASPAGAKELSPALQRWVKSEIDPSPVAGVPNERPAVAGLLGWLRDGTVLTDSISPRKRGQPMRKAMGAKL